MPSGVTSLEVKTFDGELIWETEYAVGKCPLANWPPGAKMVRIEKLGVQRPAPKE